MSIRTGCVVTESGIRLAQKFALSTVFAQVPNHVSDYEYLMKIPRVNTSWRLDGFYPKQAFITLDTEQLKDEVTAIFNLYLDFSIKILEMDKSLKAKKGVPHGLV
jgi:hypothetical protein